MAVRDLYQAIENPQVVHRGLIHRFPYDAELGYSIGVPKAPYQLSKTGVRIHSPPPRVGQHTDEILRRLGFGEAEIRDLHTTGKKAPMVCIFFVRPSLQGFYPNCLALIPSRSWAR